MPKIAPMSGAALFCSNSRIRSDWSTVAVRAVGLEVLPAAASLATGKPSPGACVSRYLIRLCSTPANVLNCRALRPESMHSGLRNGMILHATVSRSMFSFLQGAKSGQVQGLSTT